MFVNSDFRELLSIFNVRKVKYLVVGGYAFIKYAEPHLITAKLASGRPHDLRDAEILSQTEA